ncbi:competence/damage-inducible protein A [Mesobacillus subterraneus]|uniref:Putative competence-damage inducible protein n=1 Tax=Mesobacillus subterraneus TaxID=285983 RepID=A0A3R9EDJ7_9BACI|nr:competence/damage-inducible protein A [Mesobacillus subterraneus]RSD27955.1 competence/damage-inducible protein A [Mesobacillus subterraneus]
MNAEIIAVGSELLLGQIVNTNARFLSRQLADLGINVFYHTVVGDNPDRLRHAMETAQKRAELIIFTGGLGPTKDDLTKDTIASQLGKQLVLDEEAMDSIEQYFERTNRVMTENNRKQALVIEGSVILKNDHGMAPGMFINTENHKYMLLPGPPSEMEPMFIKYGQEAIVGMYGNQAKIESRVLRFFGIGEAALEAKIEDLIDQQSNPTIAPLAGDSEVTLRLTARDDSTGKAEALIDQVETEIRSRVGEYLYGYGETSLMAELSRNLKDKGMTISAAESLTGGLFQQELTALPGASSIFRGGLVCYSNEAKMELVKVRPETIERFGAVSSQCAEELAVNTAALTNSDIGISFTGVAGPDSLEGHAAGTVFIGLHIKGKPVQSQKLNLGGSRNAIRNRTVKFGCQFILNSLKGTRK